MKKIFPLIFFLLLFTHVQALEKKLLKDDEWEKKIGTLNWKNLDEKEHYAFIKKTNAKVLILDNEIYLDNYKDINQFSWWAYGHGTEKTMVMHIRGTGYDVFLDYRDDGYVKLDDWKNVNSNNLLSELREIAKANAIYLKEKNLDYVNKIDWIYKPTLNQENKSVSYSYKVDWNNGQQSMESKNLILGKKGYLESAFVVAYKKDIDLKYESDFSKDFVNGVIFNEGFKHSDYKPGDKIAAAGIGGLVAGSLGVKVLAKTGLLAKLLKFWWILLAPLAFFGKFLSGKESSSNNSSASVKRRKRKK
ncbi:DUF2167 domain-containing protein [Candidatus Pelagibacter bacterium]|nr:DUF2167 domain-containing protein [Candidatus Pelagibacter bacterium]